MEEIFFMITIGMLILCAAFGLGVCFGKSDKRTDDGHNTDNIHNDVVDRDDRGMDRRVPSVEEITLVLYNLRIMATPFEKWVIDYVIDKEGSKADET